MTDSNEQKKREQWQRLKNDHPEFADVVMLLSKTFGKHEYVLVEVDGKYRRLG
jgi:hypothetical protein